jgi:transposase-like protein
MQGARRALLKLHLSLPAPSPGVSATHSNVQAKRNVSLPAIFKCPGSCFFEFFENRSRDNQTLAAAPESLSAAVVWKNKTDIAASRGGGEWIYLYRAVDKDSKKIYFLPTMYRHKKAAMHFVTNAIFIKVSQRKSRSTRAGLMRMAIDGYNDKSDIAFELRQIKDLNILLEQDHRAVNRIIKLMLSFKSFRSARNSLAGIEAMHMIRKGVTAKRRQSHACAAVLFLNCLSERAMIVGRRRPGTTRTVRPSRTRSPSDNYGSYEFIHSLKKRPRPYKSCTLCFGA